MTTEASRASGPKPPRPLQGGDMWMTVEEVRVMLRLDTLNQVYKRNSGDGPPYSRIGKQCRYLYSEVQNWMLNQDTRIKDDPSLQTKRPIEELPRTWPPSAWPIQPEHEPDA